MVLFRHWLGRLHRVFRPVLLVDGRDCKSCAVRLFGLDIGTNLPQATVLMSLLLGFSLFWFRRNTYEMFLIVHIGFSVVILYTMWA